jgi:heat shock protein HslJ
MSRLFVLLLASLLLACTHAPRPPLVKPLPPTPPTLYRAWLLDKVNGQPIDAKLAPAPSLHLRRPVKDLPADIDGLAGCNRFFGEGKLRAQKLVFESLSSTVKECPAHLDALELAVMDTISNEPKVTFLGQHLILRASGNVLEYRPAL